MGDGVGAGVEAVGSVGESSSTLTQKHLKSPDPGSPRNPVHGAVVEQIRLSASSVHPQKSTVP